MIGHGKKKRNRGELDCLLVLPNGEDDSFGENVEATSDKWKVESSLNQGSGGTWFEVGQGLVQHSACRVQNQDDSPTGMLLQWLEKKPKVKTVRRGIRVNQTVAMRWQKKEVPYLMSLAKGGRIADDCG
jgi:hypothetical protein